MKDRPQLEAEMDRRIYKELVAEIAKIVRRLDFREDRRAIAARNPPEKAAKAGCAIVFESVQTLRI
ncbi:MAG: hypothetical protein IRY93_01225 [Chthoniobacterales bacterium]|jgi:hypothetical protein|nr:hypothetical protein [Chthoniobacterales bacterium]